LLRIRGETGFLHVHNVRMLCVILPELSADIVTYTEAAA